jgi:hypothetical protein
MNSESHNEQQPKAMAGNPVDVSARMMAETTKAPSATAPSQAKDAPADGELLELNIPQELMNEVKGGHKLIISSKPHQYKLTLTATTMQYINQKQQKKVQYHIPSNELLVNGQPAADHNAAIQGFSNTLNAIGEHCMKQQADVKKERVG